jgi:hypothetical protein
LNPFLQGSGDGAVQHFLVGNDDMADSRDKLADDPGEESSGNPNNDWAHLPADERKRLFDLARAFDFHNPERDLTPRHVVAILDFRARQSTDAMKEASRRATDFAFLQTILTRSRAASPPRREEKEVPERLAPATTDHDRRVAKVHKHLRSLGKPDKSFYEPLGGQITHSEFCAWKRDDRKHCGKRKWGRLDAAADQLRD